MNTDNLREWEKEFDERFILSENYKPVVIAKYHVIKCFIKELLEEQEAGHQDFILGLQTTIKGQQEMIDSLKNSELKYKKELEEIAKEVERRRIDYWGSSSHKENYDAQNEAYEDAISIVRSHIK